MIFALFSLVTTVASAQQAKIEREERIKSRDVPSEARNWLRDAYEGGKKVKWYQETNEEGVSYEAKFKWKREFYSVEFSVEGLVLDIEIDKDLQDIEPDARENLETYFDSLTKFRLLKLQQQFTGDAEDLEDMMDEDEFENITLRYEVEFYAVIDESYELWEGLFDRRGELISIRKIVQRPTDNLDY
jgi:hypothetical protein